MKHSLNGPKCENPLLHHGFCFVWMMDRNTHLWTWRIIWAGARKWWIHGVWKQVQRAETERWNLDVALDLPTWKTTQFLTRKLNHAQSNNFTSWFLSNAKTLWLYGIFLALNVSHSDPDPLWTPCPPSGASQGQPEKAAGEKMCNTVQTWRRPW